MTIFPKCLQKIWNTVLGQSWDPVFNGVDIDTQHQSEVKQKGWEADCKGHLDIGYLQIFSHDKGSCKPPSSDPNRLKDKKSAGKRKPGGQKGHGGKTLSKFTHPDQIKELKVDPSTLPKAQCKDIGYETRQVVDIDVSRVVTEYRAQILEDKNQKQYVAEFPKGMNNPEANFGALDPNKNEQLILSFRTKPQVSELIRSSEIANTAL